MDITPCRGEPRLQYARVYHRISDYASDFQYQIICALARESSGTVGFSVDDAMIGDLDDRTMIEYGRQYNRIALESFRDSYYPGVVIQYRDLPPDGEREIVDIVDELPHHETLTYSTRPLEAITTLTIHHTVSPPDRTIESIAAYHVNSRGWPGIGYHFVIAADGTIYQTNYLETKSYHAGSYAAPGDENYWSVGISLQGDFTYNPPPRAQQDAARWLVAHLKWELGLEPDGVLGHRQMPGAATACPGNTYTQWLPYVAGAEPQNIA